ncbi:MAG: cupin domain-containing protein [bacterium]|nr:cupin domain-containing protein [bacterium]
MPKPAIVTAREMSATATFIPSLGFDWGVVCTGQHVQLTWSRYEPGVPYEMHQHDYEQVSVLLKGRMRLTVGDLTRDIAAGDAWFAPAGVEHGGDVIGSEPAVFLDIYGPPSASVLEFLRTHGESDRSPA